MVDFSAIFTAANLSYSLILAISLLLAFGVLAVLHRKKAAQLVASTATLLTITAISIILLADNQFMFVFSGFAIYPFSMLFMTLFSVTLMLVNILSYRYSNDYPYFSLLFAFVALGVFAITMASNFISILIGLELVALPSAFMIMINGKSYVEAAVKLFILSAIAVSALALAVVLIFPYSPQLSLAPLSANVNITGSYLAILALLLFIAGLAFDAAIFPFNLWVPDVYTGAPANITALLAGINKKVAFVALFEIMFIVMLPFSQFMSLVFQALAIGTMFFGNIVALVQTNVKRLFAYSSISQAGYIAIGFAAASQYGTQAGIFQIFAHSFMIIGAFAIVLWLESKGIKNLKDYSGLSTRNGAAALALTIFMLSMIGIPPLMGFIGKFLLFTSALSSGLLVLTVIAIINSFISVYYYARVIMAMYSKREKSQLRMDWAVGATVAVCIIAILVFGLYPAPLVSAAATAASSLFAI